MSDEAKWQGYFLDYLSKQPPDLWHSVARGWNWSSGTWALKWIVQQDKCMRETAQAIFWAGNPEYYLPTDGLANFDKTDEVFELLSLILERWNANFYKGKTTSLFDFPYSLYCQIYGFTDEAGYFFKPGTIGFHSPDNPIVSMSSFRDTEAQCNPKHLIWKVPNNIGWPMLSRRKLSTRIRGYSMSEGYPDEFVELAKKQGLW